MSRKIRVGIDVDNVIVDFSKKFVDEFNNSTGKNLKREDLNKWNLKEVVNEIYSGEIDGEIANELLVSGVLTTNMDFKETARETLFEMHDNDSVEIVIITALHESLIESRKKWFKDEFSNIDYELHFETKKSIVHKNNPIDYLIDDGLHNLDELSKYIPVENCICIEEPYNRESDYITVKTLKDAYEYILDREKINSKEKGIV